MERDIRKSALYTQVQQYFHDIHAPGTGTITDATDVSVSPDGRSIAFTGTVFKNLESGPGTGIYRISRDSGDIERVCVGDSGNDRMPRWSRCGNWLAFLSDRCEAGIDQLYVADVSRGFSLIATPAIEGFVEYFHWSPDSERVLLGIAGFGADLAGCQGGATIASKEDRVPDWAPVVETGDAENLWRSVHVYDVRSGEIEKVAAEGLNYWEATWLGADDILAVVSESHSEGSWYASRLIARSVKGTGQRTLYVPKDQIGLPCAAPSGARAAIVEAVCSDRVLVCGTLILIDNASGETRTIDTLGIEITFVTWRDETTLLVAGHKGSATEVADIDAESGELTLIWSSEERTIGAWYPSVAQTPNGAAAITEAYDEAPAMVLLEKGKVRPLVSFASNKSAEVSFNRSTIESITWQAPDGREIQGWLVRPEGRGPFPLVMDIHGGPIWQSRNRWAGRLRGAKILADYGIASVYPNPRGSSGYGQEFARLVKGDVGGADTHDFLSAIDTLVERGIANPDYIGVTGISYGGYVSAWLITQDTRFTASVPISPVCNWYSQHRTSQLAFFDEYFLESSAYEADGMFFNRSPVMFAANVKTPTLQLTGALDRNTPPTQALEFHRSLVEQGVRSELATYPTAGHGIRGFPEVIDATTRYVGWFLEHFDIPVADKKSSLTHIQPNGT